MPFLASSSAFFFWAKRIFFSLLFAALYACLESPGVASRNSAFLMAS